jgi:hypothetical protein
MDDAFTELHSKTLGANPVQQPLSTKHPRHDADVIAAARRAARFRVLATSMAAR